MPRNQFVFKIIDEIHEEVAHEHRCRKALEADLNKIFGENINI